MHRKGNFPRDASPRKNLNRKPLSSTTPEKNPRHSGQTPPAINLFCQYLTSPQRRIVINVLVLTCSFSGGERNEIISGDVTFSCSSRARSRSRPRFPRARPDPYDHEYVHARFHDHPRTRTRTHVFTIPPRSQSRPLSLILLPLSS